MPNHAMQQSRHPRAAVQSHSPRGLAMASVGKTEGEEFTFPKIVWLRRQSRLGNSFAKPDLMM